MLKKTDYINQINKENREYLFIKALSFIRMKLSFGEKRKQQEFAYSIFDDKFDFHTRDNALPDSMYFKPTDIILYDLIRKEDLPSTQKGIIKLIKSCYSHKFWGGNRSEEDIDNLISGLDRTLHSGNSWYSTSIFDFADKEELDYYIDHFEIRFHNFSSSFAAVEMQLALSKGFIDELSQFITEPYKKTGNRIHRTWGRNRKKTGGKILYGVSTGALNEIAKSQITYEQLLYVKTCFLREIRKYLPLMKRSANNNMIGINVFETNITPSLDLGRPVYIGLGLNEMQGFYFSTAERLYTSTETINKRYDDDTDMMFIYNPNRYDDYKMYRTGHNLAISRLTQGYMEDLYRVIVIKDLGYKYKKMIGTYRNIVNECKTSRKSHKKLLKIQYELHRDFYDFKKIDEELPVEDVLDRAKNEIETYEYARKSFNYPFHTCGQFTNSPKWVWEQIKNNYIEVENDLNRKIEIADSLSKYSNERKNRRLIIAQVILALFTFILLIFPDKAQELASIIKRAWLFIRSITR